MLKCRLVLFFAAARALAPDWRWSFGLTTGDLGLYPEDAIVAHGWPSVRVHHLDITADAPAPHGCFTAHRVLNPQRAARHFASEARALVADLQREFDQRHRDFH